MDVVEKVEWGTGDVVTGEKIVAPENNSLFSEYFYVMGRGEENFDTVSLL